MTMLKLAVGSLVSLGLCLTSFGQYNTPQSSVWAVGSKKGLDFSTNPPTIIDTGLTTANEGSATISDANGQILFCTNGTNVWGSDGLAMPNGTNINGTGLNTASTTQAAVIVPFPSHPGKYFLFSLTPVSNCRLFSNIVDMHLNNGLGDIDTSYNFHKVLLKNGLTEKMTVAKGCNNDAWLLVHSNTSVSFLAYHITANGLDTVPVISTVGNLPATSYNQGVMKVSPDGTKIMTNIFTGANGVKGLEIYDFDSATGMVSNAQLIDEINAYGGSFSPKGSKIYVQEITTPGKVWQYDLENIGQEDAKTFVGNSGQYCDMKIAPDGKIYVASNIQSSGFNSYRYFARINNPDAWGTDCDFQDTISILSFPSGNVGSITQGLPNDVIIPTPATSIQTLVMDSIFCTNDQLAVEITLPNGANAINWSDNLVEANRLIIQEGIYIANYQIGCSNYSDTFKISQSTILAPTIIETGNTLSLDNSYAEINWFLDGNLISTAEAIEIENAGIYTASVKNEEGCEAISTNAIQSSLSVDVLNSTFVHLFPNPITNNQLTVKTNGAIKAIITNLQGKVITQFDLQQDEQILPLDSISRGSYFITFIWDNGRNLQKQIILN